MSWANFPNAALLSFEEEVGLENSQGSFQSE